MASALSNSVVRRSFWSLSDQGVVSLGSFLTTLVLGRHLPEAQFGRYALLIGILYLLNSFHTSLITYPLTALIVRFGRSTVAGLLTCALLGTLVLALPGSAVLALTCHFTGQLSLAPLLVVASVLWQAQETARRALLAEFRFHDALLGDAISYLGQAGIVFYLMRTGTTTLAPVLFAMAGTSLVALLVQLLQVGLATLSSRLLSDFTRDSLRLGGWLLPNNLIVMANLQAVGWAIVWAHGYPLLGALQAISNVLGTTHPVTNGLHSVIVPATANQHQQHGVHAALRTARHYILVGTAVLVPVFLVFAVWPGFVLNLFYGDTYLGFTLALQIMVLYYAIDFVARMLESVLCGLQQTRAVLIASAVGVVVTLALTIPLAIKTGINGAILGGCVAAVVRGAVQAIAVRRTLRDGGTTSSPPAGSIPSAHARARS